jgi:hypothetical protein
VILPPGKTPFAIWNKSQIAVNPTIAPHSSSTITWDSCCRSNSYQPNGLCVTLSQETT